jgi:hypothetical protein
MTISQYSPLEREREREREERQGELNSSSKLHTGILSNTDGQAERIFD